MQYSRKSFIINNLTYITNSLRISYELNLYKSKTLHILHIFFENKRALKE